MVTVRPPEGTLPANETTPAAGARTVSPARPPTSIPRCWPPAYGSSPKTNGRSTGPPTGQDQARAAGAPQRAATRHTTSKRRIGLLLVVEIENRRRVARRARSCQERLQRGVVEAVARDAGEPSNESNRAASRDPGGDELAHRGQRRRVVRRRRLPRSDDQCDLAFRRLVEAGGELLGGSPHDLLEHLRQLAADRPLPRGHHARERRERARETLRRLVGDGRVGRALELAPQTLERP